MRTTTLPLGTGVMQLIAREDTGVAYVLSTFFGGRDQLRRFATDVMPAVSRRSDRRG